MGLLLLLYYRCCANLELRCVFTEGNLFLLVTPRTVFVITEGLDCHCDCRVGTILAAVAHRAVSADWLNTVIIGPAKASGKPTWLCLVYFFFLRCTDWHGSVVRFSMCRSAGRHPDDTIRTICEFQLQQGSSPESGELALPEVLRYRLFSDGLAHCSWAAAFACL